MTENILDCDLEIAKKKLEYYENVCENIKYAIECAEKVKKTEPEPIVYSKNLNVAYRLLQDVVHRC